MTILLFGLGLVLIIEGLTYALAPQVIEKIVEMLAETSRDQRRFWGLGALAIGLFLVWISGILQTL
jgi:uncharacterized protein YjeT (DUF2065 family)